jgi:hypothetical protein
MGESFLEQGMGDGTGRCAGVNPFKLAVQVEVTGKRNHAAP